MSLVVLLMASGYAVAQNLSDRRDESVSAPVVAIQSDLVSPDAKKATARAAKQSSARQVKKAVRREARAARRAAARKERRQARQREERRLEKLKSTPFSFKIGSFNVLGSQHTGPRGKRRNFAPAGARMPGAVARTKAHGVDILGTQELQEDQYAALTAQTGMHGYPGRQWGAKETDNSILYDPAVFEFVEGDKYHITFMSRSRPQPIVRLRHRATTREIYVLNTHPSAGGGKYAGERSRAHAITVGVVNELAKSGLPVFLTGDMNDREAFYCAVVARTALTAANGGGAGCSPPPSPIPVDWVTGSRVTWSNYWRDTTTVERKISDHFFISAQATVK